MAKKFKFVWIGVLIIIFIVCGFFLLNRDPYESFNDKCKEGLKNFDSDINNGEVIAKITNFRVSDAGGNYAHYMLLYFDLEGIDRTASIQIYKYFFVGQGHGSDPTCENMTKCAEDLNSTANEFIRQNCSSCQIDYNALTYNCSCGIYNNYGTPFENTKVLDTYNLKMFGNDDPAGEEYYVGKYLKFNKIGSEYYPLEIIECQNYTPKQNKPRISNLNITINYSGSTNSPSFDLIIYPNGGGELITSSYTENFPARTFNYDFLMQRIESIINLSGQCTKYTPFDYEITVNYKGITSGNINCPDEITHESFEFFGVVTEELNNYHTIETIRADKDCCCNLTYVNDRALIDTYDKKSMCFIDDAIKNRNISLCESNNLSDYYQIVCLGEFITKGIVPLNLSLCDRFQNKSSVEIGGSLVNDCYIEITNPSLDMGSCLPLGLHACDKNISKVCSCISHTCNDHSWHNPVYCLKGCDEETGMCKDQVQ